MNEVNKTLYIPLYGKAYVSSRGILLRDTSAEEIWAGSGFSLKGKAKSKWLAYYMAMRASVFDDWAAQCLSDDPNALVLHIGCGLDSRFRRVTQSRRLWIDADLPAVIAERRRWFAETDTYRMLEADACETAWIGLLPKGNVIVILEGLCMYLPPEKLEDLLESLCRHFDRVDLLMDHYSAFAAKASRFKNPIRSVGVFQTWGMDDPHALESAGLKFIAQPDMTPQAKIMELPAAHQRLFSKLYAGGISRKLYRMYQYRKEEKAL